VQPVNDLEVLEGSNLTVAGDEREIDLILHENVRLEAI